jgi:hypothetical protein
MSDAVLVALITGGMAIISNIMVAMAQNSKAIYRIEQLEKKMDKHNNLIERVAVIERDEKTQWKQIDEIKARLEKI